MYRQIVENLCCWYKLSISTFQSYKTWPFEAQAFIRRQIHQFLQVQGKIVHRHTLKALRAIRLLIIVLLKYKFKWVLSSNPSWYLVAEHLAAVSTILSKCVEASSGRIEWTATTSKYRVKSQCSSRIHSWWMKNYDLPGGLGLLNWVKSVRWQMIKLFRTQSFCVRMMVCKIWKIHLNCSPCASSKVLMPNCVSASVCWLPKTHCVLCLNLIFTGQ